MEKETVLEAQGLRLSFSRYGKGAKKEELTVIEGLDVRLREGEVLAVVGASGSGKSLLAEAILGILPGNARLTGELLYRGAPLTQERQAALRGKEIALVPQSVNHLDPLMRVGAQADGHGKPRPTKRRREIFRRLGLAEGTEDLYPFQLSGGMARRVLVSTALLTQARLVIADEPTPGMEREQAEDSLRIFRDMAAGGAAVLLITHELDLAAAFADRVAVFYAGMTLEVAKASDFVRGELRHPYSRALWQALPQNGFVPIPGVQPYAGELPPGCPFAPRCPLRQEACERERPRLRQVRGGEVRCVYGA